MWIYALKFLAKLDKKSVGRIRLAIQGLTHIPPEGDIKEMKGYNDGRKRFTKATPEETAQMQEAETSGFIPEDEIDWDDLSQYQ